MRTRKDYYAILGVDRSAPVEQIKRRYRELAKKYHPDRNPGDASAEAKFKEVQQAYQVLGDPKKRADYDRFGEAAVGGVSTGPQGQRVYQWGGGSAVNLDDLEDLFSAFGGGGPNRASIFDELFGRAGIGGGRQHVPREPAPEAGPDHRLRIKLSFEQAARGATVTVKLGARGNGRQETLDVKIPAGVEDGQVIRVKGKGGTGSSGGPTGDLLLECSVEPHPYFTRNGDDLYVDVPATVPQAVLGARIEVPCLEGSALVTLPPGTPSGAKLRLKGRGIQSAGRPHPGDLYAVIKIVPKKTLTPEERDLYTRLQGLDAGNPREDSSPQAAKENP